MTFTKEQMEILSQWEQNFYSAVNAHWARGIGSAGYRTMHAIYEQATGKKRTFHVSCGTCMFNLVRDTGVIYFKDKQEMIDAENDRKAVELTEMEAKKGKAVVKTTKKKTTKKKAE